MLEEGKTLAMESEGEAPYTADPDTVARFRKSAKGPINLDDIDLPPSDINEG